MNENPEDKLESVAENARRKAVEIADATQDGAVDALAAVENYVRKNPWLVVGGAVVAGIALAALLPRRQEPPDRLHAVKDWLEDAYTKVNDQLPSKSDLTSLAKSCDLSSGWDSIGKKLHLW